jgi:hypothetical protein
MGRESHPSNVPLIQPVWQLVAVLRCFCKHTVITREVKLGQRHKSNQFFDEFARREEEKLGAVAA